METKMTCENCPFGIEHHVDPGFKDFPGRPYLRLILCPFDWEYYKYPNQECNKEEEFSENMDCEVKKDNV